MGLGINQPVYVYLPSGESSARPYHAGIVTAVWQDDSGNTDPTVATTPGPIWRGEEPFCL